MTKQRFLISRKNYDKMTYDQVAALTMRFDVIIDDSEKPYKIKSVTKKEKKREGRREQGKEVLTKKGRK